MKSEARRIQILDAAKRVFASKGFHAANVSDIVKEAGIARGTFYLYFTSKRGVFEALLDEFFPMLVVQVKPVSPAQPLPQIWQQLRQNTEGILKVFLDNPEMAQLVLNEAVGLDKGFDEKLMDFYHKLIIYTKESLETGMEMGLVRKDLNPFIVAAMILGEIKEIVYDFMHLDFEGVDLDTLVDNVLTFTLQGVVNPVVHASLQRTGD
jgi:AcrR family transcriptional regulator